VPARADDCARACNYMRTVSEKEMAGMSGFSAEEKKRITAKSNADEPARMAKCMSACTEGRVDTACVLAAKQTMDYVRCLKPKTASPERDAVLAAAERSRSFQGRALSSAEETKILRALSSVEPRHRLPMLGAALAESAAGMYGSDLVEAFTALAQSGGERMSLALVARPLAVPIAAMGCARAVADSVRLVPAEQPAALVAACPPTGPRYFTAQAAGRAELPRLMLAFVMEHRARASGFGGDPLHKRAVEILLGN
jgi:hypothetical protein